MYSRPFKISQGEGGGPFFLYIAGSGVPFFFLQGMISGIRPKARTATVCYVPCLAHLASPLLIHNSRVRDNVIFLRKRLGGHFLLSKEGSDVPFLSSRKRSWDFLICPKGTNRHSLLRSLFRSRHISCEFALHSHSMNT